MKSVYSKAGFSLSLILSLAFSSVALAADSTNAQNGMAERAILKVLPEGIHHGMGEDHQPCLVSVATHDWGILVNVGPMDIPFYLSLDAEDAATSKLTTSPNETTVSSQYPGDDTDESPSRFMITNTLTITEKNGVAVSVRVHTFDSSEQITQDAVCNL